MAHRGSNRCWNVSFYVHTSPDPSSVAKLFGFTSSRSLRHVLTSKHLTISQRECSSSSSTPSDHAFSQFGQKHALKDALKSLFSRISQFSSCPSPSARSFNDVFIDETFKDFSFVRWSIRRFVVPINWRLIGFRSKSDLCWQVSWSWRVFLGNIWLRLRWNSVRRLFKNSTEAMRMIYRCRYSFGHVGSQLN